MGAWRARCRDWFFGAQKNAHAGGGGDARKNEVGRVFLCFVGWWFEGVFKHDGVRWVLRSVTADHGGQRGGRKQ